MRWLFFSPFILVYAGICFYTGIRLSGFIRFFLPGLNAIIFWLLFSLFYCGLVLLNFFCRKLSFLWQAGFLWMMYLFALLILSDIFRLAVFLCGKRIQNLQLFTAGASILIALLFIVYGVFHARSIQTVNYRVTLPGNGGDIRIVLVSDLHIGSSIGKPWIDRVVNIINSAEPDMVCIVGDIFDGNIDDIKDLPGIISALGGINAPLGAYACLGNHDVDRMFGGGTERIEEILRSTGIVLLQDDVRAVRENLHIAGRKDARPIGMNAARITPEQLCAGLEGTVIVLDHQPVQFSEIEKAGADLVLCGHTHSGQVFPSTLITKFIFKRAGAIHYGYWRGETLQAVVTSGAGFWGPPVRIGTNSEVAVIDINFMQ